MKRGVAALLLATWMFCIPASAGIGSRNAMYVGGTVNSVKERSEGQIALADTEMKFQSKNGEITIPYERVTTLEYGQKAGRRVGLAVAVSPVLLFSKKRKHYLTIGYKDAADKQQAAVFEIGKSIVRETLASLEAKTGKKVEYEDDEARKGVK